MKKNTVTNATTIEISFGLKMDEMKNFKPFLSTDNLSRQAVQEAVDKEISIARNEGKDPHRFRYTEKGNVKKDGVGVEQADSGEEIMKENCISLANLPEQLKEMGVVLIDAYIKHKEGDRQFFVRLVYERAPVNYKELILKDKAADRINRLFKNRKWWWLNLWQNPPGEDVADFTINVSQVARQGNLRELNVEMVDENSENESWGFFLQ